MKKKTLAALLTAVMTFSSAACGGGVKNIKETRQQEAQTM